MIMFDIKTEKDLIKFLKIVSEEAVKETKSLLQEKGIVNDPYVEKFQKNLEGDELLVQEQDEEEKDEEEKDEEEEDEEEDEEEAEKGKDKSSKENPAMEKALSLGGYDEGTGSSFESVMTAINTMRAGRSLKDKEIKTELNDYYDRLDENEREVLLLFLKELSKILTGALDGDEAQDPSDPKTYFDIIKRDKSKESAPEANEKGEAEQRKDNDNSGQKIDYQKGEEDTTPPIKVNESQDVNFLRKKIRLLMRA
jgi:hypothetical protein